MTKNKIGRDVIDLLFYGQSSRRFLLATVASFSFSIAVILCTLGLMDGFETILRTALKRSSGDIIISHTRGFFSIDKEFTDLLQSEKVLDFTSLIQTQGFLIADEVTKGVVIRGVDPLSFNRVTQLEINPLSDEVIVGVALARELNLKPGSEVVLTFASGNEAIGNQPLLSRFKIASTISHGIYEKDLRFIYLNQAKLASILGNSENNKFNQVLLNLPPGNDIKTATKKLNQLLPADFSVKAYWSEFSTLLEAVKVEKLSISFVLQLIVVISIFNVMAFVIYLNEKRTREIFLLKALGIDQKTLSKAWLKIVFFVWLLSCIVSLILTFIFDQLLKHLPIFKLPGDIYVLSDLSLDLQYSVVGLVFLLALIWVMIISFITFGRFKKNSVAQNLRKEFS